MKLAPIELLQIGTDLKSGDYLVKCKEVYIPIRYNRGRGNNVVISFHGAINRDRFQIPKFQTVIPPIDDCHQIKVADPTLSLGESLSMGWFIGGEGMPLQKRLAELLEYLSAKLNFTRRIYVGGSAGGFAALFYSWSDPGSVCIAINPQVDLKVYSRNQISKYMTVAWPSRNELADAECCISSDLPKLYESSFENFVIYLQSTGDYKHFERQLPRFCRVGFKNARKFILQCNYWGIPDHGSSVPVSAYSTWVRAVLVASSLERQSILDCYSVLNGQELKGAIEGKKELREHPWGAEKEKADLLRDYLLSQQSEG